MRYIILFLLAFEPLSAAYVLKQGKFVSSEEVATSTAQEHYAAAVKAYEEKNWKELLKQATIVTVNFEGTPYHTDALHFIGIAHFHLEDYELANNHFSDYLKVQTALKYFRETIEYKFQIAEHFRKGAKRHIAGVASLPKWMSADEDAVKIYDEVISALPSDDLAARSLLGKAKIQLKNEDFTASIETLQTLIRRFRKHALAPKAYVQIAKVYLTECQVQYPDADFIDLAEINLRKFRQDFPSDERVVTVEHMFYDMQEVYAKSFYEIGQFFERTKKPHAAVLYYHKIIKAYPNSRSAELSKARLKKLRPPLDNETSQ
ncbi:MAG: outer membrane protein assembly factor BamD [Verrucomicrobia bacterium]|nr:outer membrane protein assembly factor BamD [Verrucomicrobiota bacterium]